MNLSELAMSSLKSALLGRTVRYEQASRHHMPSGHGEVMDLITDENGKIHLQVKLTVGLGKEAKYWAPFCEWTLVNGIILDGVS